jgi:dienelactone hydrolase
MKIKTICTLFLIFVSNSFLSAQLLKDTNVVKETFIYSIKDSDTLRLSKYYTTLDNDITKPCVIFVFGGGFLMGSRDFENYIDFYKFLAKEGYVVAAIDYRLGLKRLANEGNPKISKLLGIFESAIFMAVEDLFDATNYIVQNAEKWNIDKKMIIAMGSSAGGITVLQGAYEISRQSELSSKLPDNFNYAGIISLAGAIYSNGGKLKWKNPPAPIQMFHGNADSNVPYDKVKLLKYGFFGSKHIKKKLKKEDLPYYFYSEENIDHVLANSPLYNNRNDILIFLNKYVKQKMFLQTDVNVTNKNKPCIKKNFKIKDYVKTNFYDSLVKVYV